MSSKRARFYGGPGARNLIGLADRVDDAFHLLNRMNGGGDGGDDDAVIKRFAKRGPHRSLGRTLDGLEGQMGQAYGILNNLAFAPGDDRPKRTSSHLDRLEREMQRAFQLLNKDGREKKWEGKEEEEEEEDEEKEKRKKRGPPFTGDAILDMLDRGHIK